MLSDKQFYILLAIAGAGLLYSRHVAADVVQAVDPLNQDNAIKRYVDRGLRSITGREVDRFGRPLTLGGLIAGG